MRMASILHYEAWTERLLVSSKPAFLTRLPIYSVVGFNGHYAPLNKSFVSACQQAGIPQNDDLNTHKGTLGAGRVRILPSIDN